MKHKIASIQDIEALREKYSDDQVFVSLETHEETTIPNMLYSFDESEYCVWSHRNLR
jgi:hypothetical protein